MDRRSDRSSDGASRGGVRALRPASSGGRVPPHNLQAEESVLGAILLSRESLGAVIEKGLRYDDFYKPSHQQIYDTAVAVFTTGGPVDTITVADELSRAGLLESVGGVEALHALQNLTPSIANAPHYAEIVQDAAMLRRLIMVAADIAEIGYSAPDDVADAIDEAESRVFMVAERRISNTYVEIGELMKQAIERIEENFARGDTITGTATGLHDLDELLSGLQPSTLNIIGARPAMGKCVAWDTPMVDVATGAVVTAAALFESAAERDRVEVLALGDDARLERRDVSVCVDDGVKPVFTVTTRSGRQCHRHGEPSAADGPRVATARRDHRRRADRRPHRGAHLRPRRAPGRRDRPPRPTDRRWRYCSPTSSSPDRPVFRLPRTRFGSVPQSAVRHRRHGLGGEGGLRPHRLHVGERAPGTRRGPHAHPLRDPEQAAPTVDRATQVIAEPAFEVEIMDAPSLLRFCDEIGILGKELALARVRAVAAAAAHGYSLDTVPSAVWDDIYKAKGDLTWAEISRRCGRSANRNWHPSRRGPLRRETVAALAASARRRPTAVVGLP